MHMFILTIHLLVASVMTVSILSVVAAAYARQETRAYLVMLISFGVTIASGIALLFVSAAGLGRFCAMMSAFTLMTLVARQYYRKRLAAPATL